MEEQQAAPLVGLLAEEPLVELRVGLQVEELQAAPLVVIQEVLAAELQAEPEVQVALAEPEVRVALAVRV